MWDLWDGKFKSLVFGGYGSKDSPSKCVEQVLSLGSETMWWSILVNIGTGHNSGV